MYYSLEEESEERRGKGEGGKMRRKWGKGMRGKRDIRKVNLITFPSEKLNFKIILKGIQLL